MRVCTNTLAIAKQIKQYELLWYGPNEHENWFVFECLLTYIFNFSYNNVHVRPFTCHSVTDLHIHIIVKHYKCHREQSVTVVLCSYHTPAWTKLIYINIIQPVFINEVYQGRMSKPLDCDSDNFLVYSVTLGKLLSFFFWNFLRLQRF